MMICRGLAMRTPLVLPLVLLQTMLPERKKARNQNAFSHAQAGLAVFVSTAHRMHIDHMRDVFAASYSQANRHS